jgi:hypothetical protein
VEDQALAGDGILDLISCVEHLVTSSWLTRRASLAAAPFSSAASAIRDPPRGGSSGRP